MESHSAKGFNVQSQDNGLSWRDRLCSSRAPVKAFFDTIEISFPSRRNSRSTGSGPIKSEVRALKKTKNLKLIFFELLLKFTVESCESGLALAAVRDVVAKLLKPQQFHYRQGPNSPKTQDRRRHDPAVRRSGCGASTNFLDRESFAEHRFECWSMNFDRDSEIQGRAKMGVCVV